MFPKSLERQLSLEAAQFNETAITRTAHLPVPARFKYSLFNCFNSSIDSRPFHFLSNTRDKIPNKIIGKCSCLSWS